MAIPAQVREAVTPVARGTAGRIAELRLLLLVGDVATAAAAAWIAPVAWALFDQAFVATASLPIWQLSFAGLWAGLMRIFGGGRVAVPALGRRSIQAISQSLIASIGIVLVTFYFAPFFAPRGSTLLTLPLAAGLTLLWRYGFLRIHERASVARVVAVLGLDEAATRAARAMAENEGSIFRVRAFLADATESSNRPPVGPPILSIAGDFWDTVQRLGVDVLVVGHSRGIPQHVLADLARCYEHGIEALPATTVYEQLEGRVLVSALEADWYAELPTGARGLYMIAKRAFDLVFAVAVGAIAVPLMAVIAIAISIESRGPVLLRQVRVGLRGRPFVIHKFRSMRVDAEAEGQPRWASENDDRVTPVGRFLRRSRLDELPQLWDVLRGKMSIVGPRPERPEFVEQLARELPLYRARALVPPGITGWAQIQFPYAGSLEENLAKLEYDLYYIRHLGPLLDLRILLRTALTPFSGAGR